MRAGASADASDVHSSLCLSSAGMPPPSCLANTAAMLALLSAAVLSLVPGLRVPPSSCSAQSARRCSPARACQFDVNAALTDLNAAVAAEDYAEAARLKKLIDEAAPEAAGATTWPEAMPVWLLERLEQLGLRFPTPIQSAALRAPADAVLRAPTGSGKTVAFLCVLLAQIPTL